MLTELLAVPIAVMRDTIDAIPQVGAVPADIKRARGKSVALIRDVIQHAQSLLPADPADDSHS
jgi:hypothetical protein